VPKTCIQTTYPVWRARNLPFGEGVLSLPQRGETNLEMYGKGADLIETFEGHSDVVKEFVWRKGSNGICIIDVCHSYSYKLHRGFSINHLVKRPYSPILAY
jgi:hypothetical protein